jgi:hypothetical protein
MDRKRVNPAFVGLAALTVVRLWVAAVTPLAPDEAYYWVWSRALAAGYLDHPPMVALWIRIGTVFAGASGPWGILVERLALTGDREEIRAASVLAVLTLLEQALENLRDGVGTSGYR